MKRTALALLLLAVMLQFSGLAIANPIPYRTEPSQEFPALKVNSPKNGEVFTATTVEVNFTVTRPDSWNLYWLTTMPVIGTYDVYIYLDGNLQSKYPFADPCSSGFPNADYSVSIYRLTRGTHGVKIDVEAWTYYDDPSPEPGDYLTISKNITETVHFTVNADLPKISILSPSGAYDTPSVCDTAMDIPLILTVNETVSSMKYRLVGSGYGNESASFAGNLTLHQIPLGSYLLMVYVNDMSTYAVSHFSVANPSPQETEPSSTLWVIATIATAATGATAFAVYFLAKARNKPMNTKT